MKAGDRVVCVISHSKSNENGVIKGKIFEIIEVRKGPCNCVPIVFNIGITHIFNCMMCMECYTNFDTNDSMWWFSSSLFRPIQYNSATEELANKEIIEEKSDIPVKEPQKEKV